MYEEEKRNRDNSRNRDKAQPPGGRPNYYQVANRNSILETTNLNLVHNVNADISTLLYFLFSISICRQLMAEEA